MDKSFAMVVIALFLCSDSYAQDCGTISACLTVPTGDPDTAVQMASDMTGQVAFRVDGPNGQGTMLHSNEFPITQWGGTSVVTPNPWGNQHGLMQQITSFPADWSGGIVLHRWWILNSPTLGNSTRYKGFENLSGGFPGELLSIDITKNLFLLGNNGLGQHRVLFGPIIDFQVVPEPSGKLLVLVGMGVLLFVFRASARPHSLSK
jgi:hypothetical protein